MKKKLKIALFDQKNNAGGGDRYTKKILEYISNFTDQFHIDYYGFSESIKDSKLEKKI